MSGTRHASVWVCAVGVSLSLLYALQLDETVSALATLVIGVGTVVVQAAGLRISPPAHRAPWVFLLFASAAFLAGIVVRPWSAEQPGALVLIGDLFTVSGYVLVIAGLAVMLGRGGLVSHALTDGTMVCLGAGLLALEFLALPAARIGDRPEAVSLLAGLYPLWDVLILLLVLNLAFSNLAALTSYRLIAGTMVAMFVGDVGYAWIGAEGRLTGSPLLDLPFLIGFTLLAAAALHPSRARMRDTVVRRVQAWSSGRLALIVPALASPVVLLVADGITERSASRVTAGLAAAGLMSLLLVRAVSAVRSNAAIQRGLRHQATHDALTDLPNRLLLVDRLEQLLAERADGGPAPWVLFIDLDGFKLVNDHWGHDTGDALLLEVSQRLRDLALGHTVARMSGDEFVIAGGGTVDDAARLAMRIQRHLAQPVELPGIELVVTSSIGIAVLTDQTTADALLRDADLAMYRAKAEGRARWSVFDTAMRQTVRDRVEIELALRQALARGQLWVAYQPLVDVRTGRVLGAEALIRWTHPERGAIPPVEFIGVAEETGLVEEIGAFVLDQAVGRMAAWQAEGVLPDDFRMSVNASARQLRDQSLRLLVAGSLGRYGLPGSRLDVEITESIMMDDSGLVAENLTGLRELGVGLSVDDFGTGYSSLSYLSRFPVTTVKIDRAFVSGLGVDPGDEAIARAVVAMAAALRLDVIAEGVETPLQRDGLIGLEVERGQGWLWGRAEDHETFAALHLRRSPAAESAAAPQLQAGIGNS